MQVSSKHGSHCTYNLMFGVCIILFCLANLLMEPTLTTASTFYLRYDHWNAQVYVSHSHEGGNK